MFLFRGWLCERISWGNSKALLSCRHSIGNELLILLSLRFFQVTLLRRTFSKLQSRERMPVMDRPMRRASHTYFQIPAGLLLIFFSLAHGGGKSTRLRGWQWGFRSEVSLRVPFMHLGISSGEEFLHSSFYGTQEFQLLCLWGFFDLRWLCWVWKCLFFFFWESEQSIMIVLPLMGDDPSQYYTIVSTRQMRTVSESPESYDFIHLLTQHCYIRESNPPRKYFFVPGPITKPLLSWS